MNRTSIGKYEEFINSLLKSFIKAGEKIENQGLSEHYLIFDKKRDDSLGAFTRLIDTFIANEIDLVVLKQESSRL